MIIKDFEELISWKKAMDLSVVIYNIFKNNHDFSFRDQIQRAAISIINNIAEGFERQSNKEFKQFLYIAKGSCGEVRSMLHIAMKLEYIKEDEFKKCYDNCTEISRLISGFIKKL